jgi:hypothetical protein
LTDARFNSLEPSGNIRLANRFRKAHMINALTVDQQLNQESEFLISLHNAEAHFIRFIRREAREFTHNLFIDD